MAEARTFIELDKHCLKARKYFRSHSIKKHTEIDYVFSLCYDLIRSIGKFKKPEEWKDSREEHTWRVLIQAIETILAMYYLSESGFWDNALALTRNYSELLVLAMAIGYDKQCYVDWKHQRNFNDFYEILSRVKSSVEVPDKDKSILPTLKRYWIGSSQKFSHNITPKSIRIVVESGQLHYEPKIVTSEFQEGRLNTTRNMVINVLSVTVGVFNYSAVVSSRKPEFPEALEIIARLNQCFQNEDWKNQQTK